MKRVGEAIEKINDIQRIINRIDAAANGGDEVLKKYAVRLYSYQLGVHCVKAVCSTKEKAYEMMLTLFNMLLGWLPEEANNIQYSVPCGCTSRIVSFTPKGGTTIPIFQGIHRVQVEIYCVEFEEDSLPSEDMNKEHFFEGMRSESLL